MNNLYCGMVDPERQFALRSGIRYQMGGPRLTAIKVHHKRTWTGFSRSSIATDFTDAVSAEDAELGEDAISNNDSASDDDPSNSSQHLDPVVSWGN